MNIERTIEFILQCQARAEVRMDRFEARMAKMEARFDKEIAAINRLSRQGGRILAQTQRQLKELAAAHQATERTLRALLDSMRKSNGRRSVRRTPRRLQPQDVKPGVGEDYVAGDAPAQLARQEHGHVGDLSRIHVAAQGRALGHDL